MSHHLQLQLLVHVLLLLIPSFGIEMIAGVAAVAQHLLPLPPSLLGSHLTVVVLQGGDG